MKTNQRWTAAAAALAIAIGSASAAEAEQQEETAGIGARARALTAALVPGVLVHGTGHWMLGDKKTARRLRRMELVGLLLAGAGGAVIVASGADENMAMLYTPLLVAGGATFMGSFLADVIGVAARGQGAKERAFRPGWGGDSIAHSSAGYRFVHHPNIDVRHVARASAGFRAGPLALAFTGEIDPRASYQAEKLAVRYDTSWRPLGASMDAGFDVTHRRLGLDGFSSIPAAAWGEMTWSLAKLAPSVPGAYGRTRLGAGVETVRYGAGRGDTLPFLVAQAGLGFRLGPTDWELNYDHRKDGFPGGSWLGRLPGMLGSFGVAGRARVWRRWSLVGEARWGTGGTAWMALEKGW